MSNSTAPFGIVPGDPTDDSDVDVDFGLDSHLDDDGNPRIVERHLIVPPAFAGRRLDHFIKAQIPRLSRTKIQTVIATQLTCANRNMAVKPAATVAVGDHFVIRRAAHPEPACPRTFGVIYEDRRVLVVDKPAGLPVHASAKFYFNTLARVLSERYPNEPGLQLCHRLDRETSGCIVIARDRETAAFVKQAIGDKHRTTKQYLAVVHGQPSWDTEHLLDTPLRLSTHADATRLPEVRVLTDPNGMPSQTMVRVERRNDRYALVRCTLITGRQHQIRVHLAHAGFPIVGDKIYGHDETAFIDYCDRGLTPDLAELFVLPRHALHAAAISVPHPEGGAITAEAALPADMAGLIAVPSSS